jgi:hypothetical protein
MFNQNPFMPGDDPSSVTFRDVILVSLLVFVFMIVWMIPHINPEGEDSEDEAPPPGNVIVEMRWPDDVCVDIDLWMLPPTGNRVGFSSMNTDYANLLRDDTGCSADPSGMNYENMFTRGIKPGKYTVNAHWYSGMLTNNPDSVTVRIIVSVKKSVSRSMREILVTDLTLDKVWQELTAFSFELDEDGELVPGSVNDDWRKVGKGNPEATSSTHGGP